MPAAVYWLTTVGLVALCCLCVIHLVSGCFLCPSFTIPAIRRLWRYYLRGDSSAALDSAKQILLKVPRCHLANRPKFWLELLKNDNYLLCVCKHSQSWAVLSNWYETWSMQKPKTINERIFKPLNVLTQWATAGSELSHMPPVPTLHTASHTLLTDPLQHFLPNEWL